MLSNYISSQRSPTSFQNSDAEFHRRRLGHSVAHFCRRHTADVQPRLGKFRHARRDNVAVRRFTPHARKSSGHPRGAAGPKYQPPAPDSASSEDNAADEKPSDASSLFATSFDDPPPHPTASVQSARFGGVQPDVTTVEELTDKWGEGKELSHDGDSTVMRFSRPSFPQVDVTVSGGKARSIVINLDQAIPTDTLARELQLRCPPGRRPRRFRRTARPSLPQRGVLFSITPDGKRVSQVLLDKIDLSTFLLRAETDLQSELHASLADVDFVLSQQPKNARTLWLRAQIMSTLARYNEALHDVDAALENDKATLYRLTRTDILGHKGRFDDAIQESKNILGLSDVPRDIKAKALCQLGNLLAGSPAHDYKMAMESHMAAIKIADPLSVDKHLAVRRSAKLLLVNAHLAVANDIACGYWQQKEKIVPKWLEPPRPYAEDCIAHEDAEPMLRLHLAQGALAACAGAEGKVDSVPWARMALQAGKPLIAVAQDPWTKLAIQWQLGVALSDGLVADELRGAVTAFPTQHLAYHLVFRSRRQRPSRNAHRRFPHRLALLPYRRTACRAAQRPQNCRRLVRKSLPLLDRPFRPRSAISKATTANGSSAWAFPIGK